jgi:hypothetical protein
MSQTAEQLLLSKQTQYSELAQQGAAAAIKLENVNALLALRSKPTVTAADIDQAIVLSQEI